ncbi:MAG: NAD-dependent epimerase/dehydratase family protein [Deltaproteobacteria bacterium]|nr:NAD-dependent epimerase/dehydratase family protein [Deltaproteobacteria bacterium]
MRIVVTGGAGFIGSAAVVRLLARGDEVVVLDALAELPYAAAPKRENLAWAAAHGPLRAIHGDVRDPAALAAALPGADAVLHLAGLGSVPASRRLARLYHDVNVVGTASVLAGARAAGVGHVVVASSSTVYGDRADGPFREDDALAPATSPYAASKRVMEAVCEAFARATPSVAVVRPFAVYGPRLRPDLALCRFALAALAGAPLPITGDLSAQRDWTYVDDVVDGLLAALDRRRAGLWNLGAGAPRSLAEVVATLGELVGAELPVTRLPPRPGDVALTWADRSRAVAELGLGPATELRVGLARTLAWYRAAAGALVPQGSADRELRA